MTVHIPLEYKYALDAVSSTCWASGRPLVVSNFPELDEELELRGLSEVVPSLTSCALWIEPRSQSLYQDLSLIASHLCNDGTLQIILSRPLSRILPEVRRAGFGELGATVTGSGVVVNELRQFGFQIERSYGIHSARSVALGGLSRVAEYIGRDDLSDRYLARARASYCVSSFDRLLSTVMLISARKSQASMSSRFA